MSWKTLSADRGGSSDGHRISRWLVARSVLDRVIATLLLIALAPLLAVFAVAIRLSRDKGKALLRLDRIGQHGTTLKMWKLRTMRVANSDGSGGGSALTGGDGDSRVTAIGKHLRHWRADELPQLMNVVAGNMALLGPRPEAPVYVDVGEHSWRHVLAARPGIAGPTQVLTHDWENDELRDSANREEVYREVVLPVKLAIDQWYVANASPWIDLIVAVSLGQHFVGRRRVTLLHRRVCRYVPEAAVIPHVPAPN